MSAAPCRQLSSTRHILTTKEFAEFSALERDIEALVEQGMLEAFEDEHGVVRYRATTAITSAA